MPNPEAALLTGSFAEGGGPRLRRCGPHDADVRRLVASGPLSVAFQPIVELERGELWAYEALGRIGPVSSDLAPICASPATLLDAAHDAGCLVALDRRWRQLAIDAMAREPGEAAKPRCFLNIDPRVADDPGFAPGFTRARILAAGLDPSQFVLELTEVHSDNAVLLERALEHYVAQGFLVALDDVGAGAQSLERVLRLKPSILKLDRSLLHGIDRDGARRRLVGALVELGRDLGARVVAEGIETREELVAAVHAGVHFAQGWFLGRPDARLLAPSAAAREAIAEAKRPRRTVHLGAVAPPMLELVDRLAATSDLEPALRIVSDSTAVLLGTKRVSLRLLDASRERLLVAARTGDSVHDDAATGFVRGEGLVGRVIEENAPLRLGDAMGDPRFASKPGIRAPIGSFLGAPLRDATGCFGVLATTAEERDAFDEHDEQLLRFLAGIVAPHLQARRLERLARTDALTGLLNRHALADAIPDDVDAALPLSIALVDLDRFKLVNDRHGHSTGDAVLRAVARELLTSVRTDDRVLRLGGEEFLLVLPRAGLAAACALGERVRERVRATVHAGDTPVTISAGVAHRREGESRDALLARADAALYRAKAAGRDRVFVG